GGTLLSAGTLAVTGNSVLGTGGLSAGRAGSASLRAQGSGFTFAPAVDIGSTAGVTFTLLGDQPLTFTGPATVNTAAQTILVNASAPVTFGGNFDLGNQSLTLNTISNNTTTISGNVIDTAGLAAPGTFTKAGTGM